MGDLQSKASPSAMSFAPVTPPGSPIRSSTPSTPLGTPPSTPDFGPAAAYSESVMPATPWVDRGPDKGLGGRELLYTTDWDELNAFSAWKCAEAARRGGFFDWFVESYRRAAFSDRVRRARAEAGDGESLLCAFVLHAGQCVFCAVR